jgi:hypothetical protein
MGNLHAMEFANLEESGQIDLTAAMTYQLRNNFYPPHPAEMVPVAVAAIKAYREGDPEKLIESPYEHKRHGYNIPAHALIESFRLWTWVD